MKVRYSVYYTAVNHSTGAPVQCKGSAHAYWESVDAEMLSRIAEGRTEVFVWQHEAGAAPSPADAYAMREEIIMREIGSR